MLKVEKSFLTPFKSTFLAIRVCDLQRKDSISKTEDKGSINKNWQTNKQIPLSMFLKMHKATVE